MAPLRFAQRAWLPQERECGLAGPAFLTVEDSEWCDECPSPFPGGKLGQGRAGKEPGKETIAHPELGLWVRLESGNSVGVRSGEGG